MHDCIMLSIIYVIGFICTFVFGSLFPNFELKYIGTDAFGYNHPFFKTYKDVLETSVFWFSF